MEFHYTQSIDTREIPALAPEILGIRISHMVGQGWRVISFCALRNTESILLELSLLCLLAHEETGKIAAFRTSPLSPGDTYPSITPQCPQMHWFERELHEQWKIIPEGHPWLKPIRFVPPMNGERERPLPGDTNYFTVAGSEVHEVAVGPIHAGVIEPGHFRFQCYGEEVMHLEISLGYQHRGIEQRLQHGPYKATPTVMECVAGDSSVAHATAYAVLTETLLEQHAPAQGQAIRRVALELERLANHTGDMGAIAGDTGFLSTASWCGRIRGDFLNITALLCGNRFGRGLIRPGGTLYTVDPALCQTILERLELAYRDMCGAVNVMFHSASVLDRLQSTGILSTKAAQDLGIVGLAARASGIPTDARFRFPIDGFQEETAQIRTLTSGDVYARALLRYQEAEDSMNIIRRELAHLAKITQTPSPACTPLPLRLPPHRLAVAFCEGWRGTVCHTAATDASGSFALYKIIDPSFHNWIGVAMVVRNEQISDFPLCNKSFNLSYCGHDL